MKIINSLLRVGFVRTSETRYEHFKEQISVDVLEDRFNVEFFYDNCPKEEQKQTLEKQELYEIISSISKRL